MILRRPPAAKQLPMVNTMVWTDYAISAPTVGY
jgi:hypothetical protein